MTAKHSEFTIVSGSEISYRKEAEGGGLKGLENGRGEGPLGGSLEALRKAVSSFSSAFGCMLAHHREVNKRRGLVIRSLVNWEEEPPQTKPPLPALFTPLPPFRHPFPDSQVVYPPV